MINWCSCNSLFFYPIKEHVLSPVEIDLDYEDVYFTASDGVKLHGWYLEAANEKGVLLFLHGNAENISTHIGGAYYLPGQGISVFIIDYRGYGKSEGKADVPGLIRDTEAAMQYLVEDRKKTSFVVFGQSLGGAIAIPAIAESKYREHIKAIIIESAFSSYRGIVRDKLKSFFLTWPLAFPLSFLVSNQFSPIDYVDKLNPIPLLFILSEKDVVVDGDHTEKLFTSSKEPKELWRLPQGHSASSAYPEIRARLIDYIIRKFTVS